MGCRSEIGARRNERPARRQKRRAFGGIAPRYERSANRGLTPLSAAIAAISIDLLNIQPHCQVPLMIYTTPRGAVKGDGRPHLALMAAAVARA